jgi:hypothetical protein
MLIITDDSIVTYGRKRLKSSESGEHPETYAMKNVKSPLTNGADHTFIAGSLEWMEN